jgi:hypothetical protein
VPGSHESKLKRGTWVFFRCRSPYDHASIVRYFEKVLGVTIELDQLDLTTGGSVVSFSKENLDSLMAWLIEGHQLAGEMVSVSCKRGQQY